MKKLLYISYFFPPVGGSGVQRSLKFTKNLPLSGWQPIVLMADHRYLKQPKDYSLCDDEARNTIVYNSFSPDLRWIFKVLWGLHLHSIVNFITRKLILPDPELLWLPFAKKTIKQIFKQHTIDLVLITAPPYSPLFLGQYIKKHYHVPYVVDFRDMWTMGVGRLDAPLSKRISANEKSWEKKVITQAKAVVVVNQFMANKLSHSYPELAASTFTAITNGYDEDDFTDIMASLKDSYEQELPTLSNTAKQGLTRDESSVPSLCKPMHLVFTGSFYDRFQPDILWEALHQLVTENKIKQDSLMIDIYGKNNPHFVLGKFVNNPIINTMVQIHGYLPHHESIAKICAADALLLFSPPGPGADMDSHSKLFEYLRSGVPILALVAIPSAGADILKKCHCSFIANSASIAAIKFVIAELLQQWQTGKLALETDWAYVSSFERRALTAKLARVLDSAIEKLK
ncbi:MAG: glycosyltransferase [Candidatus Cloacimonetes bacterium]|nr:glycosyltransferase [Candidatus Cloacimonadota bacterium]